jgi:DNA-binding response OmpR family regulator
MRILVIEDDRKAARLLAEGLQEERFVVDVAHSGGKNRSAGINRTPHCVLFQTGHSMPIASTT